MLSDRVSAESLCHGVCMCDVCIRPTLRGRDRAWWLGRAAVNAAVCCRAVPLGRLGCATLIVHAALGVLELDPSGWQGGRGVSPVFGRQSRGRNDALQCPLPLLHHQVLDAEFRCRGSGRVRCHCRCRGRWQRAERCTELALQELSLGADVTVRTRRAQPFGPADVGLRVVRFRGVAMGCRGQPAEPRGSSGRPGRPCG